MKPIILFCLALLFAFVGASAENSYTVNTRSMLNMRSGPGSSYDVVTQLAPGSTVTMIEDNGNTTWVQIEQNGKQGYVMKKYLDFNGEGSTAPIVVKKNSGADSAKQNAWLLWTILGLVGAFWLYFTMDIDNDFLSIAINILIPSSIILYTYITPNAMWFCDPDVVGWFWTIVNVFLLIMVLAFLWGVFKTMVVEVFTDFRFMELIVALLFGAAIVFLVITAIKELFIVAIIMIIGALGGGSKVGTFIDNDGNTYDVFRR